MVLLVEVSTLSDSLMMEIAAAINHIVRDNIRDYGRIRGIYYKKYEGPLITADLDDNRMIVSSDPVIFVHGLRTYWKNDPVMLNEFVQSVESATVIKVVPL